MNQNTTYQLSCQRIATPEDFHNALSSLLSFPDYYGNDLDALYDCLTDKATEAPFALALHHWDALEEKIGIPRCVAFRHVFSDVAADSPFSFTID